MIPACSRKRRMREEKEEEGVEGPKEEKHFPPLFCCTSALSGTNAHSQARLATKLTGSEYSLLSRSDMIDVMEQRWTNIVTAGTRWAVKCDRVAGAAADG